MFGSITYPYWHATPENKYQALFFRFLPNWLLITDHDALKAMNRGNLSIYSPQGQALPAGLVRSAGRLGPVLPHPGRDVPVPDDSGPPGLDREREAVVPHRPAAAGDDGGRRRDGVLQEPDHVARLRPGLRRLVPERPARADSRRSRSSTSSSTTCSSTSPTSRGTPSGPRRPRSTRSPSASATSCRWTCRSPAGSFTSPPALFRVTGDVYGWDSGLGSQGFPYFGEQATGAWFGLGLMLLYAGRAYWRSVFQTAWAGARSDDPAEARRYRVAFAGLLVGRRAAGAVRRPDRHERLDRPGLLRHRVPARLRHHARPGGTRLAA